MIQPESVAKSVALSDNSIAVDPELAKIMEAWPKLTSDQRQTMLRLLDS